MVELTRGLEWPEVRHSEVGGELRRQRVWRIPWSGHGGAAPGVLIPRTGSEAVFPSDIAFGAPRIQNYDENKVEATRCTDIDSAEEHRLTASIQHVRYEQQLRRYHDRNVHERDFNVGDLVLRRIQSTIGTHKLSSPWEGPFVVSGIVVSGTYHLQRPDSTNVGNPCNMEHLRRFYL
ncbi:uncharacterized protein LOC120653479 [Panicum virgatum]|uniref:uncharacterized protein LOC120653479 n=1 Tax=Panicum virgatum TaxID=38727 RepID=UPI0019D5C902|nr:uncharacterized protein LOC120653479 [Panicum virgatum]